MKKIVIFLILVCLSTNLGFAMTNQNQDMPLGDKQSQLFVLPVTSLDGTAFTCYDVEDFDYNEEEDRLYFLFRTETNLLGEYRGHWFQAVTDLEGNIDKEPNYLENFQYRRRNIEFDGDLTISFEGLYTAFEDPHIVDLDNSYDNPYDRHKDVDGAAGFNGIRTLDNHVAYYMDSGFPYFQIGTLNPLQTAYDDMARIYDFRFLEYGSDLAYDFRPNSDEFIYGGGLFARNEWKQELRIVRHAPSAAMDYIADLDEGVIGEFTLQLPDLPLNFDTYYLRLSNLYAAEDHIVVLYHVETLDRAYIQRYTYEGEFMDQVEVNYYTRHIAEGPNGSTLYLQQHGIGDATDLEVMQVNWDGQSQPSTTETSSPRPLIQERSHMGTTIATYKSHGFGLLKKEDPETGEILYRAPLRCMSKDVRLRVPYPDIQTKLQEGANALQVEFQGQTVRIEMERLDCSEILSALPCQNEPTLEIHCTMSEDGAIQTIIQLLVYEKTTPNTTVVHRTSLQ